MTFYQSFLINIFNMRQEEDSPLIKLYYEEASKRELLSRKEEEELFATMHKWSLNKSHCGGHARKKGMEAREILITSNLRLVIKIAKSYMNVGLDFADLINEGNSGLVKAVDKFELGKGAKLSHYAGFWIKQSIMRALANHGRTIRLPSGAVQQKMNIIKYRTKFKEKHGHFPSNQEIAKDLKLSIERVILLNESALNVTSLNSYIGGEVDSEPAELGSMLADESIKAPDSSALLNSDNSVLYDCLSKLSFRERYIIEKRYALSCQKPETLEVIGKKFGVTRERIRQVEKQAMAKLSSLVSHRMRTTVKNY